MDYLNRLLSIIASLEETLGHCINALSNNGDISQVNSYLATTQQILSQLRPVLGTLVQIEDNQSLAFCSIKDSAIELLLSLDSTQPSYEPRPHEENIDLIHSILECLPNPPPPPDNVAYLPTVQNRTLPKEFSEAMHTHIALTEQYGEDSPQAKLSFMMAIQLAPDWFMDDIDQMSIGNDLLPEASGYLANGEPVFKLEDIATQFGLNIDEAKQSLTEMMAIREELGLSNVGKIVDPSTVHRKQ